MKSGLVAIAGRPNVGKSTLVNALCGEKVAIVSDKPQTTRRKISGIWADSEHQLVLIDLPGFQRPRDALTERMQATVDTSFDDVDGVAFILAADEQLGSGDEFIARRVFASGTPVVIVMNKIDRVKSAQLIEQIARAGALGDFHALHPVSAKDGAGVDALRDELVGLLPEGPPLYPDGVATDQTIDERMSELVREQVLHLTRQELPHAVGVQIVEVEKRRIHAVIIVETDSQKRIVVGSGGAMVKKIGTRARREIEALLGHSVFLEVRVKVRPGWRDDAEQLRRLGI